MNTPELQQLKLAWLSAKEAGDIQEQMRLLRDHPAEQEALADFIAAYYASGGTRTIEMNAPVLPVTQRAIQQALARVLEPIATVTTLAELRKSRQLSKVSTAQGLRLSVDVWNKFEAGAIELTSLTQRQLARLAQFFQVNIDQFGIILNNSQPAISMNRRQSRAGAQKEQGPQKQSFIDALARSTMSVEDRRYWTEE
ncbi:MAG TPA: helix-turn-helix transcriptional regulator [Ktedonobacteraceae bacterium]|jgi:transcriptional regulator with XRE-family HTH domain